MSKGKIIGYKRVSTVDQNPDRQLEGVEVDKIFVEYATGKNTHRPQLTAMLDYVREDDLVVVHSMDRLARNVKDLRGMVDSLTARRISVCFIKENLTFTGDDSPMSKLLLMLLGSFAEFEYSLIRERQMEGIKIAQKLGRYRGRKRCLDAPKLAILEQEFKTRKSISQIAIDLNVSRFSVYKYLKGMGYEFKKENFARKKKA